MLLRKLLSIFLFSIAICGFAQDNGSIRISATAEVADLGYDQINYAGIQCQVFVDRNISLNYNYSFGWADDGRFIFHYPVLVTGVLLIDDFQELAILALLAPEGVSYHGYPNHFLEIEAYCNPLCSDYNIRGNERMTVTGSLGVRPHFRFNEAVSVAPHFGLKLLYGSGEVKQMAGISLEVLF